MQHGRLSWGAARPAIWARIRLLHLVLAAAGLHLATAVAIWAVGRLALLPDTFDRDGIGISFAIDSVSYRAEAAQMSRLLSAGRISDWISYYSQFHVKLYALAFALFGRLLGLNILSLEPLNLFYYLLIVWLVFTLAREVFDRETGILAAGLVAIWPSFLLNSTQMLRDPLFIAAMLTLFLILSTWITRSFTWPVGVLSGLTAGGTCLFLWLIRGDMWELVLAIVFAGFVFLLVRQLSQRRVLVGNLAGALVLAILVLSLPRLVPAYRQSDHALVERSAAIQAREGRATLKNPPVALTTGSAWVAWLNLPQRISLLRHNFIVMYPGAGSNLDTDVELNTLPDLVRYFPRAVLIGLCAPFPDMWVVSGAQVGLRGRLLGGAETLLMYVIEALAVLGLCRERRRLAAWLLWSIVFVGVTALGYVVVNISTLYRMRYVFWMLLIILGMRTVVQWKSSLNVSSPPWLAPS